MASKITKIKKLSSQRNHPVLLENFETYLEHRQHDMKCLLANDRSISTVDEGVGNVLLVSGEKQMYYGHIKMNPAESEQPNQQLHTFVARRNRATGKIRLFEVRSSTLLHVAHDRPSAVRSNAATDDHRLLQLQKKFNPRAAYLVEKRKNNRIDLSVMEEKLQSLLTETVVKDVEDPSLNKTPAVNDDLQLELYTKCNPNAKTLANLYDAQKVIGDDEWRSLTEAAQNLLQIPVEYLRMANVYLENKVKAIMQSAAPESEANLAVVRTCIYMDVLVKLAGRKAHLLVRKGGSVSSFTKVLDGPIRKNFLQRVHSVYSTADQVTKYTRNKALLYYIALLFALEGQAAIGLNIVHQSLEIPRNELIMYASIVGARYNSKQDCFTIKPRDQIKTEDDNTTDVLAMLRGTGKRSRRN